MNSTCEVTVPASNFIASDDFPLKTGRVVDIEAHGKLERAISARHVLMCLFLKVIFHKIYLELCDRAL